MIARRSSAMEFRVGATGSWNWNKDERRILDVDHLANLKRLTHAAELAWRLGVNYIRVDNLHDPAGSAEPRTTTQFKSIFDAIHDIEDKLRAQNVIPADRPTGIVAHNNLGLWEELIAARKLRRPPVFLTSERTGQLAYKGEGYRGDIMLKEGRLQPRDVDEVAAGGRIAIALGLPYSIAEFRVSHDLAGKPGSTYRLPDYYPKALSEQPGVTEVFVIPHENSYVGRGKVLPGKGPRSLSAAPWPSDAAATAAQCLLRSRS